MQTFVPENFFILMFPFVPLNLICIGYRQHFADLDVENKRMAGCIVHRHAFKRILRRKDCQERILCCHPLGIEDARRRTRIRKFRLAEIGKRKTNPRRKSQLIDAHSVDSPLDLRLESWRLLQPFAYLEKEKT